MRKKKNTMVGDLMRLYQANQHFLNRVDLSMAQFLLLIFSGQEADDKTDLEEDKKNDKNNDKEEEDKNSDKNNDKEDEDKNNDKEDGDKNNEKNNDKADKEQEQRGDDPKRRKLAKRTPVRRMKIRGRN
jgi:hypothetical protein